MLIRILVLLVSLGGLVACERPPQVSRHEFLAFGTWVSVSFYDVPPALEARALEAVEADFRYMHSAWHPWEPGPLARVNHLLPLQATFTYPASLYELLLRARELSHASGHLFNPAIGALVRLWGFHEDPRPPGPPPEAAAIARLVAQAPTLDDLEIRGLEMRARKGDLLLDFGGFAKGYGVDRVIEHLRELGVENAIVNAGGDLRAIGDKGGRPWQVGIRDPRGEGVLARLVVAGDESVFTSGDYERFFVHEGRRYHHILDPRSGYPARGLVSVTVVATEGALADAAATALFVAGPEDWPRVARALGVHQVMVVREDGGIELTPALAERLQWEKAVQTPRLRELPGD